MEEEDKGIRKVKTMRPCLRGNKAYKNEVIYSKVVF